MNSAYSLNGKSIVVTRARHQAPALERLIREYGGLPVSYPCIAIEPPADSRPLDDDLRRLASFDWLLLTSGNTVRAIAERLPAAGTTPTRIAAVGPATAAEARRLLACPVHFMPAVHGAGNLARSLPLSSRSRLLLPLSDRADPSTARILRERGAKVKTAIAYRTVIGAGGADLPALLTRGDIDALTFTSPSAVVFFRQRCPAPEAQALPAACIGPATAGAARELGFHALATPDKPALREMMAALAATFA